MPKKQAGFTDAAPQPVPKPVAASKRRSAWAKSKALLGLQRDGRPGTRVYTETYVELARRLCAHLGATEAELADVIGVHRRKITEWKDRHPDFRRVLQSGKAEADAVVADRLYKRATGWEHEAVKIYLVDKVTTTKDDAGNEVTTIVKEPLYVPYVERFPPDTTACIFWLSNRQRGRWLRAAQDLPAGGSAGGDGDTFIQNNINIGQLDADQRQQLRQLLDLAAVPAANGGAPAATR